MIKTNQKGGIMKDVSKIVAVIGVILLFVSIVLRLTGLSITVTTRYMQSISFVVLANTCFLLALLLKK
jgi:hypothetical protein